MNALAVPESDLLNRTGLFTCLSSPALMTTVLSQICLIFLVPLQRSFGSGQISEGAVVGDNYWELAELSGWMLQEVSSRTTSCPGVLVALQDLSVLPIGCSLTQV